MFKSTLRFLSLIVLPHPELPQTYTEASHRSKWKSEDTSAAVSRTTPPILINRNTIANMTTTTPRKTPRPMSLDVSTSAAYSSAISRRRHSLCICPEHCPPRDISPSETFWTCPAFPDSAVNSLNLLSSRSISNDNNLEFTSTPPQPSSSYSHESESSSPPTTPIFKEFHRNESSPGPLTLNRSLRREARMIVSTPSKSIATPVQTSLDQPHETPAASPSYERNANKRHSEGSSQSYSKLFELELSPILEDTHADAYFGPVAYEREGNDDGTSSFYGGTSDSSLGEPLELQTVRIIKGTATRPNPNYPQIGITSNGEYSYEPPVPALTITSPTPETLQSVVFSDSSASKPQEYDTRSRSAESPNEDSYSSGPLSPTRSSNGHWGRVEARNFLTVPVKDDGSNRGSSNAKIEQERPEKEKTSILSRAWKRLSRVFALPHRASAQDTENAAFGQTRQELQDSGTGRSMSLYGATERRDVIVARTSNGTAADTDPRERPSRIPALTRRRMAKRHGNFKRYSVPF